MKQVRKNVFVHLSINILEMNQLEALLLVTRKYKQYQNG